MKQTYDIRINPPKLSKEAIDKHKNFDALLNQFQQTQPYEVQVNPPQLSSEAINKHKNFDALLQQFQQTAATQTAQTSSNVAPKVAFFNRSLIKYGFGALLAIAASVVVVMMVTSTFNPPNSAYQQEVLALKKPLPTIEKTFEQYAVEAEKGDTIKHRSGSKIVVPASAFVDKEGKPVKGKVDIEYREFNDHVDMFLAGVPKQQDLHQNLQSVGMMQIQGYQDGEPVFIDKDKKLEVELQIEIPSDISTEGVQVYAFSGNHNVWQPKGNDNIEVLTQNTTNTNPITNTNNQPNTNNSNDYQKALDAALAKIENKYPEPNKPLAPGTHDPNRPVFDLGFDEKEFPEMKNYKGVLWEVMPGYTFKDEWGAEDKEWAFMKIERKDYGLYELFFGDNTEQIRLQVTPVFKTESQRKQMMALHEKEMADYQKLIAERQQKIDADLLAWKTSNDPNAYVQTPTRDTASAPVATATTKKIINRFFIDKFGLWNCGNPAPLRDELKVNAEFVNADGKPISVMQVFLSNNRQRLYYFANPANSASSLEMKYDASAQPTLWVMSNDQQLLVATEPPIQENGKYRFHLRPAPTTATEKEVRDALIF